MDEMEQMEQIMWQVCELEESTDIRLAIFERFSVVSVPELWILLQEDGTLICFWPNVDTAKKIRSLHVPQDDEDCTYYKCRILLDGGNPNFFFINFCRHFPSVEFIFGIFKFNLKQIEFLYSQIFNL